MKLTKTQYNALRNIIEFYYNDEKKDYDLQEEKHHKKNHIFNDLKVLKTILEHETN